MKKRLYFLILLFGHHFVSAQQFKLMGDAAEMQNDCIQLTPDIQYSRGLAYHTTKLDLLNYFEIEFDIYLGNKDEGADGIAFVIQNDRRGVDAFGTWGECIGYGRWSAYNTSANYIAPSIAIEFDTYQNYNQNDPASDHVAYLENGINAHTSFWNNKQDDFNLEDDLLHNFNFRWEPYIKRVSVYIDGVLVYQGEKDLVNDIFQGETKVIWGFTASTGYQCNLQFFCLKRWAVSK